MGNFGEVQHLVAGLLSFHRKNWHSAAQEFGAVVTAFPSSVWCWLHFAHALKEADRLEEAAAAYRQVVLKAPHFARGHFFLAIVLRRIGLLDEAKQVAMRTLELSANPVQDLFNFIVEKIYISEKPRLSQKQHWWGQRKRHTFLRELQQKNAADPNDLKVSFMLGLHHWIEGNDDQAIEIGQSLIINNAWRDEIIWFYKQVNHKKNKEYRHSLRATMGPDADLIPQELHFIAIGTTGLCNASCIHCPTGKAVTAHVPRVPMAMPLFKKIIDQMAELGLSVNDQLSFGLFGDGLVDPMVIERVRYARKMLPAVRLSVNTNGAAYNRAKHSVLAQEGVRLSLHIESMVPETYNELMAPLRLDRVMPKVEQIIEDFGQELYVSVPVSRANEVELPHILRYFYDRDVRKVGLDSLSSRCAQDLTVFNRLAIDPMPIRCSPKVTNDLIVDSDGLVLICCQDFERIEGIGDLSKESLAQVLTNRARQQGVINLRMVVTKNGKPVAVVMVIHVLNTVAVIQRLLLWLRVCPFIAL